MSSLKVESVVITPDVARQMLERNTGNRNIRPAHVKSLAGAMSRGEWEVSHQGIAFGDDGKLVDGQHRLAAVIASGVSIKTVVFYGLSGSSFAVMDQGKPRSVADIFGVNKRVAEVARLAAVIHNRIDGTRRATPKQCEPYLRLVEPYHELLVEASGARSKYFASAPSRLAAILHLMNDFDGAARVLNLYRALVQCDVPSLPPVGAAILRQVVTNHARTGGTTLQMDCLARMIIVFTESAADNSKVQISQDFIKKKVEWAYSIIDGEIGKANDGV